MAAQLTATIANKHAAAILRSNGVIAATSEHELQPRAKLDVISAACARRARRQRDSGEAQPLKGRIRAL